MKSLDLDVDSPDEVPKVLRAAAEAYQESASELVSAWQDREAGRPWITIARVLEDAARKIEERID